MPQKGQHPLLAIGHPRSIHPAGFARSPKRWRSTERGSETLKVSMRGFAVTALLSSTATIAATAQRQSPGKTRQIDSPTASSTQSSWVMTMSRA